VPHAECSDCHLDPHEARLGDACAACHTESSWSDAEAAFDHGVTGYPLLGRHQEVSCSACHIDGFDRPAAGQCADCHEDVHLGRLQAQSRGADCSACHRVEGFDRVDFSIEDHRGTRFSLEPAHRAVPCFACHETSPEAAAQGASSQAGVDGAGLRFVFESLRCESCHADPHELTSLSSTGPRECAGCHAAATWEEVAFDHATTTFVLDGAHREVACGLCHASTAAQGAALRFTTAGRECADCHGDVHEGQFATDPVLECAACHLQDSWEPGRFDHERTRFALTGGHATVACAACHLASHSARGTVVFRPTPLDCAACHAGGERR
jgi:hypothetical protein